MPKQPCCACVLRRRQNSNYNVKFMILFDSRLFFCCVLSKVPRCSSVSVIGAPSSSSQNNSMHRHSVSFTADHTGRPSCSYAKTNTCTVTYLRPCYTCCRNWSNISRLVVLSCENLFVVFVYIFRLHVVFQNERPHLYFCCLRISTVTDVIVSDYSFFVIL